MNPLPRPDRPSAQELFADALEAPPSARAAFLARACQGAPDLRAEVDCLLALHERFERRFADPATPHEERPSDRIASYKLLQKIGEGGFGTVWMAEQEEPVQRKVALKVLKAGMDTAQVVARFEAERQALALMDHPNIAHIFDGGATVQGRPYFVMELVRGVPITQYCDEASLSPRERLELFIPVCHAVQHAHCKGVIHRDLKPSNVLVTLHDGVPVPKVIDFGIAKATQGRLTDRTLFTEFRQMLGTPDYMAPEQAEMSGLDVDTRADVYSLGVLLYELLTGTRPFDFKTLLEAGYAEMLRTIKEVEPPKPSTRVSTLGDRTLDVARHRRMHPRALGPLMRGDLDWIVMKTLEKERNRRYATASALAEDLQRHLQSEPVLAGPPSRFYKLRKYVQRHRVGVGAAAAITLALVAGGAAAGWSWLRASERERLASTETAKAEAVVNLLDELLASSNPGHLRGPGYTVRQLLEDLDREFTDWLGAEPEVELRIRSTMASSFAGLALHEQAKAQYTRARELRAALHGDTEPEATESLIIDGRIRMLETDFEGARACFASAVERLRDAGASLQRKWDVLTLRQEAEAKLGRLDTAVQTASEALELATGLGDEERIVHCAVTLADLHRQRGDVAEAERLFREFDLRARVLPCFPSWERMYLHQRAALLRRIGDVDGALALMAQVLDLTRAQFGETSQLTGAALAQTGEMLLEREEPAAALPNLERAEQILSAVLPPTAPELRQCIGWLARAEGELGENDRAEARVRRLVELDREGGRANTVQGAEILEAWSEALENQDRLEESAQAGQAALAVFRAQLEPGDDRLLGAQLHLAGVLRARGDLPAAERELRTLIAALEGFDQDARRFDSESWHELGVVLQQKRDWKAAAECYANSLAARGSAAGGSDLARETLLQLACTLWRSGDRAGSRRSYDECRRLSAAAGDREKLASLDECLAENLAEAGEPDDAERCYAGAIERWAAIGRSDHEARCRARLGAVLLGKGDLDGAQNQLELAFGLYESQASIPPAEVAGSLHTLAELWEKRGDPAQALDLERRVLERRLEADAPAQEVALSRHWLGRFQRALGDHAAAAAEFEAAVVLLRAERAAGRSDVGLVHNLLNLSREYQALGRQPEREALLQDLEREPLHCASCARRIADANVDLAEIARGRAELAEEERFLRRALEIRRTHDDALMVATSLASLGGNLLLQGRPADAERPLRECVEIRSARAPDDWLRHNAGSLLGDALLRQGRLAEAEPWLVGAAEKMRPPATLSDRRRKPIERVIELYDAMDRPEEAAAWRRILAEWRAAR